MEWQEINETVNGEQKTENLRIRMKIIDMIEYAMPLIERWERTASKVTRRQNCSLHGRYVGTCKRVGIGLLQENAS